MVQTVALTLFILFSLAYLILLGNEKAGRLIKAIPAAILAVYSLISGNLPFFLIFIFAGTGYDDTGSTKRESFCKKLSEGIV